MQKGKEMMVPPTKDSVHQHALSAYLGKHALGVGNVPSPNGHGWVIENDQIAIVFMTEQPAPLTLVELIKCGCKTALC